MEALAIIGIVGNILEFLDFTTELVSKSSEIYYSNTGAAKSTANTETSARHLQLLATNLIRTSTGSKNDGFDDLCKSCRDVADEILSALARVKAKNKNSKWESIRKALRTIWSKDEITELERRLAGLRTELNLHVTADIRDEISQFRLEQSTRITNLDLSSKRIMDAIVDQSDVFSNVLQSTEKQISELRSDLKGLSLASASIDAQPRTPSSNVPFRRDPDFIDRPSILDQIHRNCSAPAGRAALVGLGGAGKSQLAIEYSYQLKESHPDTWIFWVHSGTSARFEEGFKAIADKVKLPDRDKPKVDILRLVYDWLCSKESGKWLLILDNADDATIFFHSSREAPDSTKGRKESFSTPALSTYLPQCENGSILITTRVADVAFRLTGRHEAIIQVEAMDHNQAVALLRIKIGDLRDDAEAGELVKTLEYMPLAVSQAAAYIRQRAPRSSVTKYLHDFRKSEHRKSILLNHDAGDLRRDPSASNSITITWYISFDHIRSTRPSAAGLLSLMSFFDQQHIPEYLLRDEAKPGHNQDDSEASDSDSEDEIDDIFEEDIATLRNYSLIGINRNGNAFKMHSLVQLSTRRWLEDHGQSEKWREQFVSRLSQTFPTAEYTNWTKCQELFPHAEAATRQAPAEAKAVENWALILHNAGAFAMAQGKFSVAARMTEKAAAARERTLGIEHPSTLATNCNLGLVRRCQGRYEDAEVVSRQVLAGRERALGARHLDTLASINNLAAVLRYQGKYEESEQLNRKVVAERERILGNEHRDTLTSLNNLAMILRYQGKYSDSEKFIRKALKGTETALGKHHPETLRNLSKLATVLQKQGKYEESETLQRQAIEGYTQVLGKEHPDTITGISKLSLVLGDLGRFEEAQTGMRQVLATRTRLLGRKHPSSLASAANLGSLLQSSGNLLEAETVSRQALEGREELLGEAHPDTLMSVHLLAIAVQAQGRDEEAELFHRRALREREKTLGLNHPDTITSVYSLACLQHERRRYDEASMLYQTALRRYEITLGPDHPKSVKCKQRHGVMKGERDADIATQQTQQVPVLEKEWIAA